MPSRKTSPRTPAPKRRPTDEENLPLLTREDGETRIVLGPGVVKDVRTYLEGIGRTRAYLVTGASVAAGPVGQRVRSALGGYLVATYRSARPHVPVQTAEDVATEARTAHADVLVGLGGGSPIGTAKAAAYRIGQAGGSGSEPEVLVAAIPTTYSGSEVTPVFGTTDLEHGRKEVLRSAAVRPRLALYDPELALETPPDLTASTGINALAHCVEGLYSKDAGDATRAMALRAARRILEALPRAVAAPRDLVARYTLFEGSMEAGLVLVHAGMGVHHGLCHVLGGRYNAPHGVLNAIVLPHAMRFNLPIAGTAYHELAPALHVRRNGPDEGDAVCRAMSEFIGRLGIPQRLRDLGIPRADLPAVAEEALHSKAVQANPRPVRSVNDALEILEAAW